MCKNILRWKDLKKIIQVKEKERSTKEIKESICEVCFNFRDIGYHRYFSDNKPMIYRKSKLIENFRWCWTVLSYSVATNHKPFKENIRPNKNGYYFSYRFKDSNVIRHGDIIRIPTGYKLLDFDNSLDYDCAILYDVSQPLRTRFAFPSEDDKGVRHTSKKELFLTDSGDVVFTLLYTGKESVHLSTLEKFIYCQITSFKEK